MIPVVIRHRAEADPVDTRARYARDDPQLGIGFIEEFEGTVQRIGALPETLKDVFLSWECPHGHDFSSSLSTSAKLGGRKDEA